MIKVGYSAVKCHKGMQLLLIILEVSHPFRPIFGLRSADFGPGTCRVEILTPLQCPQLFESDLSDRPI